MPDINLTFHATPDEVASWVLEWSRLEGVHLAALSFPPCRIQAIPPSEIELIAHQDELSEFLFTSSPLSIEFSSQSAFHQAHPEAMTLQVGPLLDRGLIESWLACRTDDLVAIEVWLKISREIKNKTKVGLTVIDPITGRTSYRKLHRYSSGAEELEKRGIPMLPLPAISPNQPLQYIWRLGRVDVPRSV